MQISLKAARVNADFSQKEIAAKMGVSVSTIINWENGRTSAPIKQVIAMAELYRMPVEAIRW